MSQDEKGIWSQESGIGLFLCSTNLNVPGRQINYWILLTGNPKGMGSLYQHLVSLSFKLDVNFLQHHFLWQFHHPALTWAPEFWVCKRLVWLKRQHISFKEFYISTNGSTSQNKESSSLLLSRSTLRNYSGSMRLIFYYRTLGCSLPHLLLIHFTCWLVFCWGGPPWWVSRSASRKWEGPCQLFCVERGQFRKQGPGVHLVSCETHLVTVTPGNTEALTIYVTGSNTQKTVSRASWAVLKLQHRSRDCGRGLGLGSTKPCQWLHYFVEYLNL